MGIANQKALDLGGDPFGGIMMQVMTSPIQSQMTQMWN
jgi:hypothetical protein